MASRTSIEEAAQKISKLFTGATALVIKTITNSLALRKDVPIEVVMYKIKQILYNLQQESFPLIEQDLRWHYTSSALDVTSAMRKAGLTTSGALSEQQILELNAVVSQTLNDYGEALRGAFNSAQKVITEARRTRIEQIFIEGKLQEESLKEIKEKIVVDLQRDFIAIIDKGGKTWKLDTYAEMLTRTRMREVTNLGMTTRLQMEGYDLVQVSAHGGGCDMCRPWDGRILSMSGRTPGYPTVDQASSEGLFHPNCKHRLLPYHEEFMEVSVAQQSLGGI